MTAQCHFNMVKLNDAVVSSIHFFFPKVILFKKNDYKKNSLFLSNVRKEIVE